jgi:hypothetical protein
LLTFSFAFNGFKILLQNFSPVQNFEISDKAMAKVEKVNIAVTLSLIEQKVF